VDSCVPLRTQFYRVTALTPSRLCWALGRHRSLLAEAVQPGLLSKSIEFDGFRIRAILVPKFPGQGDGSLWKDRRTKNWQNAVDSGLGFYVVVLRRHFAW
jgi:hypothetical protein